MKKTDLQKQSSRIAKKVNTFLTNNIHHNTVAHAKVVKGLIIVDNASKYMFTAKMLCEIVAPEHKYEQITSDSCRIIVL